jgi:hypothetical protein
VIGNVPTGEPDEVATPMETVPDELTVGGENVAVAPEGMFDAKKLTTPLNPALAPTVTA